MVDKHSILLEKDAGVGAFYPKYLWFISLLLIVRKLLQRGNNWLIENVAEHQCTRI